MDETEVAAAPVEDTEAVAAPVLAPAVPAFAMSLDEFCQRHSARKYGVEIIGAFHHVMMAAGKTFATEVEYFREFEKLCSSPA